MRPGIGEVVAVEWPAAEETALHRCLGGHCGTDPGLDPVALTFAHPTVEAHHDLVGVRTGIDRTAHLGHPELHRVVDEHREGETETGCRRTLAAVPRSPRHRSRDRDLRSCRGAWPLRVVVTTAETGTGRRRRTR